MINSEPQSSFVIYKPDRKQASPTKHMTLYVYQPQKCITWQNCKFYMIVEIAIFKFTKKSRISICTFSTSCWNQFFCIKITKFHAQCFSQEFLLLKKFHFVSKAPDFCLTFTLKNRSLTIRSILQLVLLRLFSQQIIYVIFKTESLVKSLVVGPFNFKEF